MLNTFFPFYHYIARGKYSAEEVITETVQDSLKRNEKSEKFIDKYWEKYSGKKWPNDENPSRFSLVKTTKERNFLKLLVDPCISYKDYIATRDLIFKNKFGEEFTPQALSTDAIVITSDSKILITRRSLHSDNKPGGLHASMGGWLTIKDDYKGGKLDVSDAILREIEEESGIKREEVTSQISYGVINSYLQNEPAVIYEIHISKTFSEVSKRLNDGENIIFSINDNPKDLNHWLTTYLYTFCAPGVALLLTHGLNNFGKDWLISIRKKLPKISQENFDRSWFAKEETDKINLFNQNLNNYGNS